MMQKQDIKQIQKQIAFLQKRIKLEKGILYDYLEYQKKSIDNSFHISFNKCMPSRFKVQKPFQINFKKMNQYERKQFYLMSLRHVDSLLQAQKSKDQTSKLKSSLSMISNLYEQANLNIRLSKTSKWVEQSIRLYKKQYFIKISSLGEICLKDCLIRYSRNIKQPSLIIMEFYGKKQQIRIKQANEPFSLLLLKTWKISQKQKIRGMIKEYLYGSKLPKSPNGEFSKISKLGSLSSIKSDGSYLLYNIKDKQYQKLTSIAYLSQLQLFQNFQQVRNGVFYEKNGNRVRKIFRFQNNVTANLLAIIITDIKHNKKRKKQLSEIKVLKVLPQKQIAIYRQKQTYKGYSLQLEYSRHLLVHNQINYIIDISLDKDQIQNFQYCIWKIQANYKKTILTVEICFQSQENLQANIQNIGDIYIGQFQEYVQNQCLSDDLFQGQNLKTQDFQDEYLSLCEDSDQEQFVTALGNLSEQTRFVDNQPSPFNQYQHKKPNYLTSFNHIRDPLKKSQSQYYKLGKGTIVTGQDWIINDEGHLVFQNEEKIKLQRGALKILMKRMGRNLFTGKGIMNVSLPVQIFSKKTYIEILSQGYCYAPRFLEQVAINSSVIQRMKQVFCMKIGSKIMFKMQKPFNPILGQTYQGLIDGCPIYGQQICHHPPITSILFYGRGYRMYSTMEPSVNLGINKVNFRNKGNYHIQFQNDQKQIIYNHPAIQMQGLLTGSRKGGSIQNSYIIDYNNKLFIKVQWGKNKSIQKPIAKFHDFVYGKLIKLKPNTDLTKLQKIKESDYQNTIGQLYGRITDRIFFNEQTIFNINKDLPYQLIGYEPPLESDSQQRIDLLLRREQKYQEAQQQKQKAQNIQRNDRKLRGEKD